MRFQKTAATLAAIATLALALMMSAGQASEATKGTAASHRRAHAQRTSLSYAAEERRRRPAHGSSGFVALSQDGESGAGFYPLPPQYRIGAAQERQHRKIQYRNAIGTAMASEAIAYDFDQGYGFVNTNSHGIFDPVDGYGTPFFAGYYN
ncbi:conserved exported protein of unknown function [Methylocella tundrae]|uniref:Uncharacterized protein n=2 Tax=Methylocella tundrae TaxID=227605 RepID=A0A4U8Z4A2_METTU|nr:conserved exported protein of unknown function [Methylocella tundrae]